MVNPGQKRHVLQGRVVFVQAVGWLGAAAVLAVVVVLVVVAALVAAAAVVLVGAAFAPAAGAR